MVRELMIRPCELELAGYECWVIWVPRQRAKYLHTYHHTYPSRSSQRVGVVEESLTCWRKRPQIVLARIKYTCNPLSSSCLTSPTPLLHISSHHPGNGPLGQALRGKQLSSTWHPGQKTDQSCYCPAQLRRCSAARQ
jgi:hypothetical protein